ncbi:MAG: DUF2000 family protein [Acidimicrobiales bacterium]
MTARKIAMAVRSDLASWQKLNVAAFLTSGLGTVQPEAIGQPYVDADGLTYPPMLAVPVRIFTGDAPGLRRCFDRALDRGLLVSVYTDEMFATMNDVDNRAAVAGVATSELAIAGFVAVGDPKQVDKAFDKLKPHD